MIVMGLIIIAVYYNLGDGEAGIQNRNGVLFFYTMMSGFGAVVGSLNTFSLERPVYIRERLSKSYSAGAYFWAKSTAEVPFLLTYPTILASIIYFTIGLNTADSYKFLYFVILVC